MSSHFSVKRPYKTVVQSTTAAGGQFISGLPLPLVQMEVK